MRERLLRLASGRGLLIALFVVTLPLVTPAVRGADEIEYFSHLRSLVFDHDLDFRNEYTTFYERDPEGLALFRGTFLERTERNGRPINFAPIGSALLWSPFYLAAHVVVLVMRAAGSSVAADGYSWPYLAAVCYASALYAFLGLLLVHDGLRRFAGFGEPAASYTVAALWLGTPVVYYMTIAPAFSHAVSLGVVSLMVWLWLRARSQPAASAGQWALVGAVGGVAGLVREQDILYLVIPALDLLLRALRERRPLAPATRLASMGAAACLAFVPQLLTYHALNGAFRPTRLVARKMLWWSPHFFQVLLDPGHGLFIWSPLLLVALVGLVVLVVRRRPATVPLLLLAGFFAQVWINGCVDSWHQAGAFGSRRFISATALLAWGLGALVAPMLAVDRRRWVRAATVAALAVFVWWNGSLMVQFGLKIMDRQQLEWPRVAVSQVTEVPPRLLRSAWMFLVDREGLVRETR